MQQKLDQYLDSLEKPLSQLTPYERQEWRTEAAQHITHLAEAHEELGLSQREALEEAIRQFGDAKIVAQRLRQETANRRVSFHPLQAITAALLVLMLAQVGVLMLMGVLSAINIRAGQILPYSVLCIASFALYLGGPIVGGLLLGRQLPRWRVSSSHTSFSRKTTSSFIVTILLQLFWLTVLQSVLGAFAGSVTPGAPTIDFRFSLLCVPLIVIAAIAGNSLTRARMRHRLSTIGAGL